MMSPDVYDYYDVRKWRNRLILGVNVAENKNYTKKVLNKSCFELNSLQKNQLAHMSIPPVQSGNRRLERLICLKIYCTEIVVMGSIDTISINKY